MRIKNKIIVIEKAPRRGCFLCAGVICIRSEYINPSVTAAGGDGGIGRRDFVYCNLSVKIVCLLQLQQAADKVDHQPKGGQQTHGGQYKKNLISIAQGGQRHQREQGAHRQLYPADHGL